MTLIDGLGYLASALVLLTFCMSTMLSLRAVAIFSNLAFISYGLGDGIYPVLILHIILLPLNVVLLFQMVRLLRKAKRAAATDLSPNWLQPFMQPKHVKAGETIFRKGDDADLLYMVVSGEVRFPEIDRGVSAGELFGEIGLFSLEAPPHADRSSRDRRRSALDQRRRAEEAVRAQPGTVAVFPAADGDEDDGKRSPHNRGRRDDAQSGVTRVASLPALRRGRSRKARQRRKLHLCNGRAGVCTGDQDHDSNGDEHGASSVLLLVSQCQRLLSRR
ncbi:cyclic nucleotide-binding domain-containing protein [Bradyrhizobium sp. 13971]